MADQVHISRDAPGIPVYLGQRRHMAQPASVPPYR